MLNIDECTDKNCVMLFVPITFLLSQPQGESNLNEVAHFLSHFSPIEA